MYVTDRVLRHTRALLVLAASATPVAAPAADAPWSWSVDEREPAALGIPVTRPGVVAVDVTASGVPIRLRLLDGAGRVVGERTGAGALRLERTVHAGELGGGPVWQALIEPAAPGRANGTLQFDAPPADAGAVAAALEERAAALRAAQATWRPTPAPDPGSGRARLRALEERRRADMFEAIRPEFERARLRLAAEGRATAAAPTAAPAPVVRSRGIGAATDARRAGWQPAPPPSVAALSATSGRPLDPIMITGSGFGAGGEVRFVVAPGMDVPAPVSEVWSDGQIFTAVPDVSGVATGYSGVVYVKRARDGAKSPAIPFRFEPALDHQWLPMPPTTHDRAWSNVGFWFLSDGGDVTTGVSNTLHMNTGQAGLFGHKGNDRYFLATRLKNGWRVDGVELWTGRQSGSAGAYVAEFRPGTDSPYVDVRLWQTPLSSIEYVVRVGIVGPRGVPFR